MAKKPTQKTTQNIKELDEQSKEIIEIESTERIVDELEELQKNSDAKNISDTSKKAEEAPHLHQLEQPPAWKRFIDWFWAKKWLTIPALVLIILAIIVAIPASRYAVTGWFWKERIVLRIVDDANNRPVSEATVRISNTAYRTDLNGAVEIPAISVGMHELKVQKNNYRTLTQSIEVPLFALGKQYEAKFHATGRVTDIVLTNRISGVAIKSALISISKDDQARTDDKGKAQIIVPTGKQEVTATITAEGYIDTKVQLKQNQKNEFQLVPDGKVYFLSKQRGAIDVIKTNLDGTDRQTVIQGTGHEEDQDTNLLASRDWRYLLLKAKRVAGKPASLYLIDTSKGVLETVEQANSNFTLIGWSGHRFLYSTYSNDKTYADNGQEMLKSFNAESRKTTTVDENQSVTVSPGSHYRQSLSNFYIVDAGVVYTKAWFMAGIQPANPIPTDKTTEIIKVNADGGGKKILKTYPSNTIAYIEAKLYEPQEVYFKVAMLEAGSKPTYAEFENGVLKEGIAGDRFDNIVYPTYLMSPNGTQAFWSEPRDGKSTLLLGGKNAENKQEVAVKSEFKAYGWFTDDYVLMQKGGSELYISSPAQLKLGVAPLKVSDYHKPSTNLIGYGYGYGGQ